MVNLNPIVFLDSNMGRGGRDVFFQASPSMALSKDMEDRIKNGDIKLPSFFYEFNGEIRIPITATRDIVIRLQ